MKERSQNYSGYIQPYKNFFKIPTDGANFYGKIKAH
jgi:hypothetical protein